jgi:hypothetical protein
LIDFSEAVGGADYDFCLSVPYYGTIVPIPNALFPGNGNGDAYDGQIIFDRGKDLCYQYGQEYR